MNMLFVTYEVFMDKIFLKIRKVFIISEDDLEGYGYEGLFFSGRASFFRCTNF